MNGQASPAAQPAVVSCAIYTRKSTEEGLDRDINSLSVQRQACEDYVRTRSHDGWQLAAEQYDDGGWSGATVKRPAFQRLLADVESGRVQCVVVHRVDRLSRSLLDFARLMAFFQEHGVAFVSVTQNFSTADPVGRLTLNLLATFAEFEREMISARTRDKIAAARKQGRWTGGPAPLGYDLRDGRLVVNEAEATKAREIFEVYLESLSLTRTVEELARRGIAMRSRRRDENGAKLPGRPYDKPTLLRVLRNPPVAGLIHWGGTMVEGVHEAIIPREVWLRVQDHLTRNGSVDYQGERADSHALLKGLLHCAQCGCRMTPTYTTRSNRRHRYYVCQTRMKRGAHACPTGRVSAHVVEQRVVEQIRVIGRDPLLIAETVRQAKVRQKEVVVGLEAEEKALRRELRGKRASLKRLVAKGGDAAVQAIRERVAAIESRLLAIPGEIAAAKRVTVTGDGVRSTLNAFGPIWDCLWPAERSRVLGLLAEGIDYDGQEGRIAARFRINEPGTLIP